MSTNPEKTKNLIIGHIRGEIAEQYGLPSNIFLVAHSKTLGAQKHLNLPCLKPKHSFFGSVANWNKTLKIS